MILRHLLLPDILEMIEKGQFADLRDFLARQPAPEIAELLPAAGERHSLVLFRLLPRGLADETFSLLDGHHQNLLLRHMATEEVRHVLSSLTPDDRTALFEELPARVTQGLLALLDDAQRRQALALLSYPEDSVGRLMTDRCVKVRPEWTVAHALDHLRRTGTDSETVMMIYVVDDAGKLTDALRLHKLILAPRDALVASLLDGRFAFLQSLQDREEAVHVFKKYDLYALPVVDADGILLGIVTADDILDVAEREDTEDFHRLATVGPLDVGLLEATPALLFRKRIGWLLGLVAVGIFSGAGLAFFEDTIAAVVALVFFLPLLIDSGGNAGSHTSTLIVRAIATGEIVPRDWRALAARELLLSAILGLAMAAAVFPLGLWRGGPAIAGVVAISMLSVVVVGSLLGTLLPILLHRMRLDPATASGPLVTSMADVLGVIIYFSVASRLLPQP